MVVTLLVYNSSDYSWSPFAWKLVEWRHFSTCQGTFLPPEKRWKHGHSGPASEAAHCFNRRLHTPSIPGAFHEFNKARVSSATSRGSILLNEKQHSDRGGAVRKPSRRWSISITLLWEGRVKTLNLFHRRRRNSLVSGNQRGYGVMLQSTRLFSHWPPLVWLISQPDLGKDWTICGGSSHAVARCPLLFYCGSPAAYSTGRGLVTGNPSNWPMKLLPKWMYRRKRVEIARKLIPTLSFCKGIRNVPKFRNMYVWQSKVQMKIE